MTAERLANEVKYTLYSLEERRIRAFAESWGIRLPKEPHAFWRAVYGAILDMPDAPQRVRQQAKAWMDRNGGNKNA
ncbi:MAG: hypothetical protein IJN11_10390 [Oscillospiraceae bacterium]|nr:hypothetical protein [Oscillospiraceae bacterium]